MHTMNHKIPLLEGYDCVYLRETGGFKLLYRLPAGIPNRAVAGYWKRIGMEAMLGEESYVKPVRYRPQVRTNDGYCWFGGLEFCLRGAGRNNGDTTKLMLLIPRTTLESGGVQLPDNEFLVYSNAMLAMDRVRDVLRRVRREMQNDPPKELCW